MEQDKKPKLKISKRIMIIGIVMLVIAVICIIASISGFIRAKRAYDIAYDQWHDNWWNNHTADLNDMPHMNFAGNVFAIFFSFVFLIASIIVTVIGARPYMNRFAQKYNNEINSFAMEEVSKTNKVVETNSSSKKKTCSYCGAKLDKGSTTCNYCGKEN